MSVSGEKQQQSNDEGDGEMNKAVKKGGNGFVKTFPQKLMELLSREDAQEFIRWVPKGDAFVILNESSFAAKVSEFFKRTKLASFKGKLYRWGFRRIKKGVNSGSYFHTLFLRDNPSLCLRMRHVVKYKPETEAKVSSNHEQNHSKQMSGEFGTNSIVADQMITSILDQSIPELGMSSLNNKTQPSLTSLDALMQPNSILFPGFQQFPQTSLPLVKFPVAERPYLLNAPSFLNSQMAPALQNLIAPSGSTFLSSAKINDTFIRAKLAEEAMCRLSNAVKNQVQARSLENSYMDSINNLLMQAPSYPQPSVQSVSSPVINKQYLEALVRLGRL